MKKNYNVSIIVPVYNAEEYLDDCIKSVINQTYGFSNIELVLVNDGSKDNSLKKCNEYKAKYDNIVVIDKPNSGVSDTRNLGYKKSTGKYIMYLDSDDLINRDSIKYLSKFLDENDNVDFVISRVRMFEKTNKWHYMDYRFKDNKKFINIDEDLTYSQYHSTGILLRREVLKDICFDKEIKYGEDMKLMAEILLKNGIFGKEKRSILYYRKRDAETSAVQKQINDKDFYLKTLEKSFKYIFKEVKNKYGYITKYFQYFILNSLVERFEIDYKGVLSKDELEKYADMFRYFVKNIDDDIIMMQKRTGYNQKYYLLKLKHGDKFKIDVDYKDGFIYFNNEKYGFKVSEFIKVLKTEKKNNKLKFYLSVNDYLFKDRIGVFVNNKKIQTKIDNKSDLDVQKYRDIYFNVFYENKVEIFEVDINKTSKIVFKIDDKPVVYAMNKDLINYNLARRFIRYKNVLVGYRKYEIAFLKKYAWLYALKYNYENHKFIVKNEFYDVFVKDGKVSNKMKKFY